MTCAFYMAPPPTLLRPSDLALFLGRRGTGKSTRAKDQLGRCLRAGMDGLALDLHDEWSQLGDDAEGEVTLGPCAHRIEGWQVLADPSVILTPKRLSHAVVPANKDPEFVAALFSRCMELAMERGDLVLAMDEVPTWAEFCTRQLNALALNSRHRRVPIIAAGQRAKKFPLTFRSQASHVNSGRQSEPEDLGALADMCGKPFAQAVGSLQNFQWCHWSDTGGTPPSPTRRSKKS